MNRNGTGKWPVNCPQCGCPGLLTRPDTDPTHERIVWGYDMLDNLQEEVRILNAVIDAGMPRDLRDALRAHYDPGRGRIMVWCEETRYKDEGSGI